MTIALRAYIQKHIWSTLIDEDRVNLAAVFEMKLRSQSSKRVFTHLWRYTHIRITYVNARVHQFNHTHHTRACARAQAHCTCTHARHATRARARTHTHTHTHTLSRHYPLLCQIDENEEDKKRLVFFSQ